MIPPHACGPEIPPSPAMFPRPFWSVVIPVYNRTRYLEGALRCVLSQDPGPRQMEIVVVDDASPQGAEIEQIVRRVGGGRVACHRQPRNLGLIPNWNACIARAGGQWVHLLHDDDRVFPGFYEAMRRGIDAAGGSVGMALCRHVFIDAADRNVFTMPPERETPGIVDDFVDRIAVMQRVQFAATVVRRDVYQTVGGFRPDIGSAADWEMWKRIAVSQAVHYEPTILAAYRVHDGSESTRLLRSGQTTADNLKAIEAAVDYLPPPRAAALTAAAREHYARSALDMVRQSLGGGDFGAAVGHTCDALQLSQSPQFLEVLSTALREDYARYAASLIQRRGADEVAKVKSTLATAWLRVPVGVAEPLFHGGWAAVQWAVSTISIRDANAADPATLATACAPFKGSS